MGKSKTAVEWGVALQGEKWREVGLKMVLVSTADVMFFPGMVPVDTKEEESGSRMAPKGCKQKWE